MMPIHLEASSPLPCTKMMGTEVLGWVWAVAAVTVVQVRNIAKSVYAMRVMRDVIRTVPAMPTLVDAVDGRKGTRTVSTHNQRFRLGASVCLSDSDAAPLFTCKLSLALERSCPAAVVEVANVGVALNYAIDAWSFDSAAKGEHVAGLGVD